MGPSSDCAAMPRRLGVREIDREQVAFHREDVYVEYRIAHRAIIQN